MGVHLITGDDPSLVGEAVSELVHRLVGDGDRTLMVDDFDGEYPVAALVDAAQTPPLLTDHRVVVARAIAAFDADALTPLLAYLADPLPTTHLVLVGGGGRLAKALTDAVKRAGGDVVSVGPPAQAKGRSAWIDERARHHGLRLQPAAVAHIERWLGEDTGMLPGLLETLAATYGPGERLGVAEVEPFLGSAGGVPPWDLTDAIDAGDTATALSLLARMMSGGERHPLAILAILHAHYTRLLRLDGLEVQSDDQAAEVLGVKPFPAKKALVTYRRIGSAGVQRAFELLARADLDLRGARDWPDDLVMEVLVARLSRLVPAPARRS